MKQRFLLLNSIENALSIVKPLQAVAWGVYLIVLLLAARFWIYDDRVQAFDSQTFQKGEVFAAVGDGKVKRLHPDGSLIAVYDTGLPGGETAGMAFDEAGNLYLTHFDGNQVYKFNKSGKFITAFGDGYDSSPESIAIDQNQNVYVGQADGSGDVLLFDKDGQLIETFNVPTEDRGSDWIDLASDQKTLFYTSEGKYVSRYDVEAKQALPYFNKTPLPGSTAYALRILPDGGIIVADTEVIVRLDKKGKVKKTYDAPGEDGWFAMNVDPDGKTFWSGNIETGEVYRFDIKSGKVISHWNTEPYALLGGLAVFGEMRVSQPFTVTVPSIPDWLPWLGIVPILLLIWWGWRHFRSTKLPTTPIHPGPPTLRSGLRPQPPKLPDKQHDDIANSGETITHGRTRNRE